MWKSTVILCLGAALVQLVSSEQSEVAGGKPGTQPGKSYAATAEAEAARITDGNSDVIFGRTGTCSLVPRMKNPWITIDLGKVYYVTNVALFLRGMDFVAQRDSNIEVRVGNSPDYTDNAVCKFVPGYFGRTQNLQCDQALKGRYVTVYRNDGVFDYLQVCEMMVYADVGFVSSCICWGDPHCQSFDRSPWLHYQGSCSYTMVQDNCLNGLPNGAPNVEVIADMKKDHPASTVSLVRTMIIRIKKYDMEIRINQGRHTTVNGVTVQGTPYHPNNEVAITISGTYVHVTVEDSVRVRFDGVYNAYVDISRMLAGNVCGLCGNADGDSTNDWMVGPSTDCMDKFPAATPGQINGDLNVVGNSWLNFIDDDDTCKVECPQPPVLPGCTRVSQELAEEHCDTLRDMTGPFGECLAQMPADRRNSFFDNCVFDSCSLEIYDEIVCTFGRALAEECAKEHAIEVEWRTNSFCPLTCPTGTQYKVCGNPCMPTCDDLKGETCGIPAGECEEGCFCKAGLVFDGKKCISQRSCGCHYDKQDVTIAVGETFFADDCSEKCTCERAGGNLQCVDTQCTGLETCGVVDGEPGCVCEEPNEVIGGTCSPPQAAGCRSDKYDITIDVGETYAADDCSETCECKKAGNKPKCTNTACEGLEACGMVNGQPACECPDPNVIIADACRPPGFACTLPRDTGVGTGGGKRFFFNKEKCKCLEFTFKGEGGNANNFATKDACYATCTGFETPEECLDPVDAGACDGKELTFYYNKAANQCKKLWYTGCGGNRNRFTNKNDCRDLCKKC